MKIKRIFPDRIGMYLTERLFWLFLACSSPVYSQQCRHPGIYLKGEDFIQQKIWPDTSATCKIKPHPLFHHQYIDVYINRQQFRFNKDSIFGYCNGTHGYRFYGKNQEEFLIAESGSILIYTKQEQAYGTKNIIQQSAFFFSTSAGTAIFPLTLIQIKRAYPLEFSLHHLLDLEFYEGDLTVYDKTHDQFRINYLLAQYFKNANQQQ